MTSEARPAAATSPERYLGWGRVAAGTSLLLSLATHIIYGPDWFEATIVAGAVALLVMGAATLGSRHRGPVHRAWARWLPWADLGVFGLLVAVGVDEDVGYVLVLLILLLTLAALRGRHTYRAALAVGVAAELGRTVLQLTLGYGPEPQYSVIGLGLAAGLTLPLAHMVELVRASERQARGHARAATEALAEAERAATQLDVMHRVVVSTIGRDEADALQQMVREIAAHLEVPSVTVLLLGAEGAPRVVATSDPAVAARDDVVPIRRGPFLHGPLARALTGVATRATDEELARMAAAGQPEHGDLSVHPLRRAGGQVVGAMVCGTPVGRELTATEQRTLARFADQMGLAIEAARALDHEADLAARYRELDRLKTDFVAITSHELRTPLTTIVGVIETMRQRRDQLGPDEAERLVAALSRQAHRLSRLVDDLGTVSHVDAGTLVTVRRPTDVRSVVAEAAAGQPDLELVVEADDQLPCADADPDRLLQVVTNLVANGEQHGTPPVHLDVRAEGAEVVIRVWDQGPGIPHERRGEVFERFVRLGATNSHSRGSGLGLAIARELVVAMGGTIEVVDREDGSAFEVRLPAHRDHAAPEPRP